MRFMMMIKSDEQSETGALPDQKVFDAMNQFNQALVDSGALLGAEGLLPSSEGAIIRVRNGKATVTDGPFAESKELIAGYWIIKAKSLDEAVAWAKRCFRTVEKVAGPQGDGTGEIEVRQIFELEDFPVNESESGWRESEAAERETPSVQPKPGLKQFIGFVMANKDTEAGVMPTEAALAAMGAYNEVAIKRGMMLSGEGLQPSSKGAKVRYSNGKLTVVDGPFTEAKELIAGYSVMQAKSLEEVVEVAKRWPQEAGDVELRIRQIFTSDEFAAGYPQDVREQDERLRAEMAKQQQKDNPSKRG